jgi:hypothetical protein
VVWKTPRALADPDEVAARRSPARLAQVHVAPLNKIVYELRHSSIGGETVPYVDPDGGGIDARGLMLLRDPSDTAWRTTRLIAPDNPDKTADNFTWLRDSVGIDPSRLVHWNIVPWWIGERDAEKEIDAARPYLLRFVSELKALKIVVCFGDDARDGWDLAFPLNPARPGWQEPQHNPDGAPLVVFCPHTSWRNIDGSNKTRSIRDGMNPEERIRATLELVRQQVQ